MKALLSGKILAVALVAIVLTACGGSDNNGRKSSSSSVPSSAAASSVAVSEAASSVAASEAASSVATSEAASSVMESSSSEATSSAPSAALVIYEEDEIPAWALWDCCGGTTPVVVVADEVEHGNVAEFTLNNGPDGGSVVGFTARNGDGAEGGTPFNATSIKTTGTIQFDLKMTQAPTAGVGVWKFKVEGTSTANAVEVNLSTSQESHAAPVLDTWQTYTFNISALETAGLNVSQMEVFMIFPAWTTGQGAIFQVDNVKIWSTGAVTPE